MIAELQTSSINIGKWVCGFFWGEGVSPNMDYSTCKDVRDSICFRWALIYLPVKQLSHVHTA